MRRSPKQGTGRPPETLKTRRWLPPSQAHHPAGFHAHLAYLLYMRGDVEGAVRQLETEKSRYPDSAKLVDFLLNRMTTSEAP